MHALVSLDINGNLHVFKGLIHLAPLSRYHIDFHYAIITAQNINVNAWTICSMLIEFYRISPLRFELGSLLMALITRHITSKYVKLLLDLPHGFISMQYISDAVILTEQNGQWNKLLLLVEYMLNCDDTIFVQMDYLILKANRLRKDILVKVLEYREFSNRGVSIAMIGVKNREKLALLRAYSYHQSH